MRNISTNNLNSIRNGVMVAPRQKFYKPVPAMRKQEKEQDEGLVYTFREKNIQQIPYSTVVGNVKLQLDAMGHGSYRPFLLEKPPTRLLTCEEASKAQAEMIALTLVAKVIFG